jgi:hypothetical protein
MGQWELHALTLNYSNMFFAKFRFDIIVWGVANTFIGWWGLRRCDQKKLKFTFFIFYFPIHEFYRILLCSYCAFAGLVRTHGNHTPSLLTSHCCWPLFITSPSYLPLLLAIIHYLPIMTPLLPLISLMLTSIFLSFVCCLPLGHLQRTRLKVQHQTTKSSKQVVSHILVSMKHFPLCCVHLDVVQSVCETTQTKSDKNKQTLLPSC